MLEIKAIGIGGIGCALLPFLCNIPGTRPASPSSTATISSGPTPPVKPLPVRAIRRK